MYVIMQMNIENGNTDAEGAPDMLKAEQVAKVFQTKYERVDALRSFSYDFPERGMVFVLGKSGCGKSTLLSLLGGLDVPTSGKIYFDGKDLSQFTETELEQYRSQSVGMIFQSGNLFSDLNVHENILFFGGSEDEALPLLERLEIGELCARHVNELSGGQAQRVAIARALIQNVRVLLCDEPTGNLDASSAEEVFRILREVAEERLVVVVTHDRENAEKYGDAIIRMRAGKIVSET